MLGAKSRSTLLLSTLFVTLLSTACEDGLSVDADGIPDALESGPSTVRILLTDAPSDYIGAAEVDIGRIELLPADDGPAILLSEDGTDGFVNLLDFQGAATTPIAEAEVDPGAFAQLRLVVEAARVVLADGYTFRDGTTEADLTVPSGAQTGIKLNLHSADDDGPLEIIPGETVLVLDFDVNQSFVLRGNPETPAGVHGVIFTPAIRVTGEDVAASISGVVTTDLDDVSVAGLTVVAEPTDGGTVEAYQSETGTAVTGEDGSYTIHFLVPGPYEVGVILEEPGLGTDPEARSITLGNSENATGADFQIIDITGSVSGTVSTEIDTVSVAGLTVTATPEDEEAEPLTTTTDDEGAYSFESVLPGAYVVSVEVGDDLVTDPALHEIEVGTSEDVTEVDFEVLEDVSGSIAGTVTTALENVTVEGLTVTADPDAEGAESVTVTTGEGGAYIFDSLAPGDYVLSVEVGDGLATDPAVREVELTEDEEETGADFAVVTAS